MRPVTAPHMTLSHTLLEKTYESSTADVMTAKQLRRTLYRHPDARLFTTIVRSTDDEVTDAHNDASSAIPMQTPQTTGRLIPADRLRALLDKYR